MLKIFSPLYLFAVIAVFTGTVSASEVSTLYAVEDNSDDDKVYTAAEQMPQFPGGSAKLMQYINEHIVYPEEAKEKDLQGHVIVQFVVTKDGKIGDVRISRGIDPIIDNEAIRVIKSLPDFIPGRSRGKCVNVWYTLPITFRP